MSQEDGEETPLVTKDTVNTEILAAVIKTRAKLYHLLKTFFLEEPSEQILNHFLGDTFFKIIVETYPEKVLYETIQELLTELENLVKDRDLLIDVWAEYTRLFIGVPIPIVVPYESFHRDAKILKGKIWLKVRDWMLDDGIILQNNSVLEDHIGIELEYMMIMSLRTLEALDRKDLKRARHLIKRQRKFLEKHVITWLPNICERINQETNTRFYKILAKLASTYVREDYSLLLEIEEFLEEVLR